MPRQVKQTIATLCLMILAGISPQKAAIAVTFGQIDVNQDRFIAVALPRSGSYYTLLILEQISMSKPCWQEQGRNPTRVNLLLLNFNYSRICGRSMDSNGYSIRQAGQDLGLDYRLSIEKRQDELVLLGKPVTNSRGQTMEIGRTRGFASGSLKIYLNSGWRFAKRTYKNKTLGHIYLTRQRSDSLTVTTPVRLSPPPSQPQPLPETTQTIKIHVPSPNSPTVTAPVRLSPPPSQPQPLPETTQTIKIHVPSPNSPTVTAPVRLSPPPSQPQPLPETTQTIKIHVPSPESGIVKPGSPAGSHNVLGNRYRVIVEVKSLQQRSRVRSLVPGAFLVSYRGRSMMQVGLFTERDKANAMLKRMKQYGFRATVERMRA